MYQLHIWLLIVTLFIITCLCCNLLEICALYSCNEYMHIKALGNYHIFFCKIRVCMFFMINQILYFQYVFFCLVQIFLLFVCRQCIRLCCVYKAKPINFAVENFDIYIFLYILFYFRKHSPTVVPCFKALQYVFIVSAGRVIWSLCHACVGTPLLLLCDDLLIKLPWHVFAIFIKN